MTHLPHSLKSGLKIGLVSYRSNPHCGGQGVYIRHLAHALSDLGHRVEVISGPPDPMLTGNAQLTMLPTLNLYDPENLFRTPTRQELVNPINFLEWAGVATMGFPEPWTFGMRLVRHMHGKEHSYDILHDNQSLSNGILSLSRQMPVVATIHHPICMDRDIAVKAAPSYFKKLQILRWYSFIGMQKKVARKLPRLITVSKSSAKDISRRFKIPESRFTAIPIGIDTNHFFPLDHIKRTPGRIIVTNSADTPLKGLAFLLHALKQVLKKRNAFLVVIGTPSPNGNIIQLIKKLHLGNHLEFTGRISHERFVKEYAKASIAVVPSLYEGFGLPAGEAMACRIPVISTTGGALAEVTGDAALLVPPGDSSALAKAILRLMDDKALREHLAQKGYDRVLSTFTWEKTAQATAQVYQEVIHAYH